MSLKGWFIKQAAESEGKALAKEDIVVWLKSKKGPVGAVFMAAAAWSFVQGCPSVAGQDIAALVHLTCANIQFVLSVGGAFLVGAGVLESDAYHKAVDRP